MQVLGTLVDEFGERIPEGYWGVILDLVNGAHEKIEFPPNLVEKISERVYHVRVVIHL